MSKKIIVHVGTHKTGTTSIQKFLRKNADLLASNGFYIPRAGTINFYSGHHNLAWEANEDERFERDLGTVEDLEKELSPIDSTTIISSEDFEFMSFYPERLKVFHERLTQMAEQVEYFVIFREQVSYAKSLYAELLTNRFGGTYDEFEKELSKNCSFTLNGNTYDFDPIRFKRNWVSVTGDCITSLEYEMSAAEGLLPSFMTRLGMPADIVDASGLAPRENEYRSKIEYLRSEVGHYRGYAAQLEENLLELQALLKEERVGRAQIENLLRASIRLPSFLAKMLR